MHHAATHCNTLSLLIEFELNRIIKPLFIRDCAEFFYAQVTKHAHSAHCRALQHTATQCNTLQHAATHCNTVKHTELHCAEFVCAQVYKKCQYMYVIGIYTYIYTHTAAHCQTLPHTATHGNTLQRTATHCNSLQHAVTYCKTLQYTSRHCKMLQDTARHCTTL